MAKKLGIGSWAYCFGPYASNPYPLDEVVRKLSALQFDGIEVCGFPPHVTPEDYSTPAKRAEAKRLFDDAGLGVCGYAANLMDVPPAMDDAASPYLDRFKQCCEVCVGIGSPSIRVDTVSGPMLPADVPYATAWRRVVDKFGKAAEVAQDAGLLLVWEFEPGFLFNKPSEIVKMVSDVGHRNFQILFDTCHAQMVAVNGSRQPKPRETLPGGIVELTQMLSGRIGHIHLIDSDNTLHGDETSTHAPFGQGVIDFDTVIPAILDAGYDGEWWSIDLCFWPEAWEVTEAAKAFLRPYMERYA